MWLVKEKQIWVKKPDSEVPPLGGHEAVVAYRGALELRGNINEWTHHVLSGWVRKEILSVRTDRRDSRGVELLSIPPIPKMFVKGQHLFLRHLSTGNTTRRWSRLCWASMLASGGSQRCWLEGAMRPCLLGGTPLLLAWPAWASIPAKLHFQRSGHVWGRNRKFHKHE